MVLRVVGSIPVVPLSAQWSRWIYMWDARKLKELKQRTICSQSVCLSALPLSTTTSTSKSTAKSSASSKDCRELNYLQSRKFRNANKSRKRAGVKINPNFSSLSNQCRYAVVKTVASKASCLHRKTSQWCRAIHSSRQLSLSIKLMMRIANLCRLPLNTRMIKLRSKKSKKKMLLLRTKMISLKSPS